VASQMRHRVLHILPDGSAGGGATAVLGLCRDLVATGNWDVGLVTAPHSPVAAQAENSGIACLPLDFFTSRFDFRLAGRLAQRIEAFRPDLLHAHGARAGLPFCLPSLSKTVPLAYTVHGFHHAKRPLPLRDLGRLAERRIFARADAVVFVSNGDRFQAKRERILPAGDERHSVIANGIDPAEFEGLAPHDEGFDLVFAGRAHRQKNPFFVVDIMEALRGSGIRLRMICGGALEPSLRTRIASSPARDSIIFSGALPRREVLRAFLSAKLYVLPSLWEGLPIAPIEALYCGLPVIASNIAGTDEVVIDGVNGRLIDRFDAAAYAQAIRDILGNEALRSRLAAQGRKRVTDLFLRSAHSARHQALYRSMIPSSEHPEVTI
jgi:glycosyltransferase involved in cell wall biosynthesis